MIYQTKFPELFSGDSTDVGALHEDLIEVMPAVEEANSISEELDKRVKFEIILVAPNKLGTLKGMKFMIKRRKKPWSRAYQSNFSKHKTNPHLNPFLEGF